MSEKDVRLALTVTVPGDTDDSEVVLAINQALNEPPCNWGTWIVGAAEVLEMGREKRDRHHRA